MATDEIPRLSPAGLESATSPSVHSTCPEQEQGEHDASTSATNLDSHGYYDVMLVGMSGMGKSTTADKMLIAKKLVKHLDESPEEGAGPGFTESQVPVDTVPPKRATSTVPQVEVHPVEPVPRLEPGKPGDVEPADAWSEGNGKVDATQSYLQDGPLAVHPKPAADQLEDSNGIVRSKPSEPWSGGKKEAVPTDGQFEGLVEAACLNPPQSDENEEDRLIVKGKRLMRHNLTFWTACRLPEGLRDDVDLYLKNLHFARVLGDTTKQINDARTDAEINPITDACQLVSNETTGMRVLDVPGFYGMQTSEPVRKSSNSSFHDDVYDTSYNHLMIMRDVLRIQSAMKMVFRRVLYFLPGRGPLSRQTKVLRHDLLLLAKFFGPSIFKSMVLVATIQPHLSIKRHLLHELFSDTEREDTKFIFRQTLSGILSARIPVEPPVLFLSLLDSGESIVEKVTAAEVEEEYLELEFDRGMCVRCSSTIRWLQDEKVECVPNGGRESDAVPYDDSLCHPIFLPRNRRPHKIEVEDGARYIYLSVPERGPKGAESSEEVCHHCKQPPGSKGCWSVGVPYVIKMEEGGSKEIRVDHTNQVEKHRRLDQSTEVMPDEELAEHGGAGGEGGRERAQQTERGQPQGQKGAMAGQAGHRTRAKKNDRGRISDQARKGQGGAGLEEEKPGSRSEVSMAEDSGRESEMVVTNRKKTRRVGSNHHRPCNQPEAGLNDVKG